MPSPLDAAVTSTSDPQETVPFSIAKRLASPNPAVRNRMVQNLSSLLPSRSPLLESTLLKIWNGLFLWYRHSENSVNQSNFCTAISAIISTNNPDFATAFLDASVLTLRLEWGHVDVLRRDRFYLLVRKILKHTFLLLRSNSWDLDLLRKVMSIIEKRAFGKGVSVNAFSYVVVEIFLEELSEFLPINEESLELIFEPFITILEKSRDSILVNKVKVHIFEKCLVNGVKYLRLKKTRGKIEKGSEVEGFGIIGLVMCFSRKLAHSAFKMSNLAGGENETLPENYYHLGNLGMQFFKLEMHMKKKKIKIKIPVPEQIESFELEKEFAKIEISDAPNDNLTKKRKEISVKETDGTGTNENGTKGTNNFYENVDAELSSLRKLSEASASKNVRFSLEDNVEWQPATPLPPIRVRLPPSATPRGSALKKGVPAGPIRKMETPDAIKRIRVIMSESSRRMVHF